MGSAVGVLKTAATRTGLTVEEYQRRISAGEKWCTGHKAWHPVAVFPRDRSRGDGRRASCGVVATDRPGVRERRDHASRGERWCRGCRAWLPTDAVSQGACRPCLNREARSRYDDDERERRRARRRHLAVVPAWWRTDQIGGVCAYGCGRVATTLDHIWPVARGGDSRPGNLVGACGRCNASKKDGNPAPWVARGLAALPDVWVDLIALALEHGSDEWVEAA